MKKSLPENAQDKKAEAGTLNQLLKAGSIKLVKPQQVSSQRAVVGGGSIV